MAHTEPELMERGLRRMFSILSALLHKGFDASTTSSTLDEEVNSIMGEHSKFQSGRVGCASRCTCVARMKIVVSFSRFDSWLHPNVDRVIYVSTHYIAPSRAKHRERANFTSLCAYFHMELRATFSAHVILQLNTIAFMIQHFLSCMSLVFRDTALYAFAILVLTFCLVLCRSPALSLALALSRLLSLALSPPSVSFLHITDHDTLITQKGVTADRSVTMKYSSSGMLA